MKITILRFVLVIAIVGAASWIISNPLSLAADDQTAAADLSPAALHAQQSNDPRLKQMSADDRQFVLDQGVQGLNYCNSNVMLSNFYSCDCFSQKVFEARINTINQTVRVAGGSQRTPLVNLISKLDIKSCVAPTKIVKYGSDRARDVLQFNHLSPSQLDQVSACVGSTLSAKCQALPDENIDAVNGLFNSAVVSCTENASSTNSPSAVPATDAASQARAESSNQTPAAAPMPQAANSGQQRANMYWFCEVDTWTTPPLQSYFSSIFEAPDQNATVMRDTFGNYVFGKYSQKGGNSCEALPDQAAAEKELKSKEENVSNPQNKHNVVEVPWEYNTPAPTERRGH